MQVKYNAFCMPYGAYELKAAYQRNMLTGMVIVTSLVLLILMATWVRAELAGDGVIVEDAEEVQTIIDWLPPPRVVQPRPEITVEESQSVIPPIYADNLIPVEDNEFIDDDVDIATRDDLAMLNSSGTDLEGNLAGIQIPPTVTEEVEWKIDSFVCVEIMPELIHVHPPTYPRFQEQAGITGLVIIWALVDEEGNVDEARVYKSSGDTAFDEAAVEAAYRCKYSPGIQNGRPVKVPVTYTVEFTLDE